MAQAKIRKKTKIKTKNRIKTQLSVILIKTYGTILYSYFNSKSL